MLFCPAFTFYHGYHSGLHPSSSLDKQPMTRPNPDYQMTHERVYESATLTFSSQRLHGHHLGFSMRCGICSESIVGTGINGSIQLQTNSLYSVLIGTFLFLPHVIVSGFRFSVLGSSLTTAGAGKVVAERKYL